MNQLRTLCVMGTFDGETNREVARIKEKLKARGLIVDGYEPHITFGIYTELNQSGLLERIGAIAARQKRMQLCFNHFGFFPDARLCFLAPCPSYELLQLHADIHKKYDACCMDAGCLYSLMQKSWAPHMTVASVEAGQAEELLAVFRETFVPFTAELTHLKITVSDASGDIGAFGLTHHDDVR